MQRVPFEGRARRANRIRQGLACLCVLLTVAAVGSASAQTLFKSTDRDGRVTYADTPAPGAAKVEQLQVVPMSPQDEARAAAERERLRRQAEAVSERERQREIARDSAHARVVAAMAALKQAQQDREAGVEPLPGERLGNRRGGARLTESYFRRQHELGRAVEQAQQRLEQAYAERNELR